jgi:MFS family permease
VDRRRIAVTLAGAAAFLTLYAPQSLLPLLRSWLGHDAALAGLVISAGTFGVALAAPFAGMLADRFGRRRVIVSAAFLALIPTLLMAASPTPACLLAARFAEGIFLPGIFAVTVAYTADEWPAVQARGVTALYVAGTVGGGFCGRLLAGVVGEFAGWRVALLALAGMQFGVAWLIRRWLTPQVLRFCSRWSAASPTSLCDWRSRRSTSGQLRSPRCSRFTWLASWSRQCPAASSIASAISARWPLHGVSRSAVCC